MITYEKIKLLKQTIVIQEESLNNLKKLLNEYESEFNDKEISRQVYEVFKTCGKISAIKKLREFKNLSLKDAKDFVENIIKRYQCIE